MGNNIYLFIFDILLENLKFNENSHFFLYFIHIIIYCF